MRFLFFRILFSLALGLLLATCQTYPTKSSLPTSTVESFRDWAGLSQLDPVHELHMNRHWEVLQKTKSTIQSYLQTKSYQPKTKTVVYPFSGIDLLNLFSFYPDSERYVLFGLEEPGDIKRYLNLPAQDLLPVKQSIRNLSEHLANRNYFTYRKMKEETQKKAIQGAFPIFISFLLRLDKEILDVSSTEIVGKQKTYFGFTIKVYDRSSHRIQHVEYYKIFLTGTEGSPGDGLTEYFSSLGEIGLFTKSAEYLFHGEKRAKFRDVLLSQANFVVQDDSGFPIRLFPEADWDRFLFGRYETSWNLSGAVSPENQAELKSLQDKTKDQALPFSFGYGFLGKKDNSQSHILVFSKRKK